MSASPIDKHVEVQMKKLGFMIRSHRKALNIGIVELSEMTGVNKSTISRMERGEHNPNFTTFIKVCAALRLNLSLSII